MKRYNKLYIGLIGGILLPILMGATFIEVLAQRAGSDFLSVFENMVKYGVFFFKLFIISIFPNLVGLYIFYKLEYWRVCSALLSCTFIYFIIAICLL
ncbi:MAG: hypothetical protein J6U44_07890 [Paludibacteraceae bacterium]|nr:hypothetical protein [Paludibacteraceae bacterium]MBO7317060.1 hypothetical protein [Paludibacteraceae bacterium]